MSPQTPTLPCPSPEKTPEKTPATMSPATPDPLPSTIANATDPMSASPAQSLHTRPPTLITLPRGLQDKILQDVLLNPARPNFETLEKPAETKFKNYFAVAFANKQLHREAKDILAKSKDLVIVSTNWDGLLGQMESHGIPIVSDHHIRKIKLHSMRIHVEFPLDQKKVSQSLALLASDLSDLSRLLRFLSLDIPHPPGIPCGNYDDRDSFPRMNMRIQFGEALTTKKDDQKRLLQYLKGANSIGVIKIMKLNHPSLKEILPGYDGFRYKPGPEVTNHIIHGFENCEWFRALRRIDGADYVSIADWKLELATRAVAAKNYELAESRYEDAIHVTGIPSDKNQYVMSPLLDTEPLLDLRLFRAGVGLVETLIKLGKWKDATHHIKPVLDDIPGRKYLPRDEIRHAVELRKKIEAHNARRKESKERKQVPTALPIHSKD